MIQEMASEEIGFSMVDMSSDDCRCSECNLGNFICDAYMHSVRIQSLIKDVKVSIKFSIGKIQKLVSLDTFKETT